MNNHALLVLTYANEFVHRAQPLQRPTIAIFKSVHEYNKSFPSLENSPTSSKQ